MSTGTLYDAVPALGGTRNPFNYEKIEEISRDNVTAWLTMEEVTQHLNLFDDESQDVYIASLELATRQAIEDYLGISIFPISYRVWYAASSLYGEPLALDLPEVSQSNYPSPLGITIIKVAYYNSSNVAVTLSNTDYFYDGSGNRIVVDTMPSDISYQIANPVFVEYSTAANLLAAYPVVKQAALLMLTHLYNHRSDTEDRIVRTIPYGVASLLRKYKPLVM